MCVIVPNLVLIGPTVAEIFRLFKMAAVRHFGFGSMCVTIITVPNFAPIGQTVAVIHV